MDKRILMVGSILAVAILVGVSFTSVVGYSKTKYNYVKASPLFNIRAKTAIKDENRDISTYDYLGKGKEETIPLPTRDSRAVLL